MPELGETEMRFPPFHVAAGNPVLQRLHRISARHPEWWMLLLAAAAWVFLIVRSRSPAGHGGASSPGAHVTVLGGMVVAMMLPLTAGRVRELSRSTTAPFGHRAAAAFVSSYLAVWMLAMLAIDAAWRLTISAAGLTVSTGMVIAAAVVWEAAPAQWRQWHQGPRGAEPHDSGMGKRMDAGGAGSGAAAGARCVASCWAQMAACVAFAHSLPVMIAFFLVQLHGRYRRPASPVVAALAILCVCLVSLAFRMTRWRASLPNHTLRLRRGCLLHGLCRARGRAHQVAEQEGEQPDGIGTQLERRHAPHPGPPGRAGHSRRP